MRKRMWVVGTVCTMAVLLTGCGSNQGTPGNTSAPSGSSSTAPTADPAAFERLLPKNSKGMTPTLRSEGKLLPGETLVADVKDAPEAGWIAQFACSSAGEVKGEVLLNDVVAVAETVITCGKSMPDSLRFSGNGTITMRITGAETGLYVMQVVKDPAV